MNFGLMDPIPNRTTPPDYRPADFCNEPFVSLESIPRVRIDMQYPKRGFDNATGLCVLRKTAAERLKKATESLPEGLFLTVWDAWRPFALQQELYGAYRGDIIRTFHLEGADSRLQEKKISSFVSLPRNDPDMPPLHTTGGAVDLTLTDQNGNNLCMGTGFDAFTEKTETDWYERNQINTEIQHNRRCLYATMCNAGFTNLPSEWWHYDFYDRMWAYWNKEPTRYKGVFTEEEVKRNLIV